MDWELGFISCRVSGTNPRDQGRCFHCEEVQQPWASALQTQVHFLPSHKCTGFLSFCRSGHQPSSYTREHA